VISRVVRAWLGGALATVGGLLAGLAMGPLPTSFGQLLADAWSGEGPARAILLDVRAPRSVGAWLVGASLSLAGALLQTATHNPVADPYLVGTSAGATLAAVLAVPALLGLGEAVGVPMAGALAWVQPAAAFGGALAAVSLAFALARGSGARSTERILVAGLVVTAFAGAATSFVLTRLSDMRLRAATQWMMGGVALPDLPSALPGLLVVAAALVWVVLRASDLQALQLGTEAAHGLGIDAQGLSRRAVWWASALSAVAVAIAGIVGFVGLMVPHALRIWLGRDLRALLPAAVGVGGGALALLDGACRVVVAPAELPLGILTALLGVPVLIGLLGLAKPPQKAVVAARTPSSGGQVLCTNLRVSVGSRDLIRGIDLDLRGPALVAVIGPNGAGKTTLLRSLAGTLPASADQLAVPSPLSYLPQHLDMQSGLSVDRLVSLGLHARLKSSWAWRIRGTLPQAEQRLVDSALAALSLEAYRDRDLGSLSGGERQRALVAMALVGQAPLLLLDEPTASLDWGQARALLSQLRQICHRDGILAIATLHDLPLAAELADLVIVLADGALVAAGPPADPHVNAAAKQWLGRDLIGESRVSS
jgi:iron complex transport system permease protein